MSLVRDIILLACYANRQCGPSRGFIFVKVFLLGKEVKMSLYDDLGVATSDTKTEGWSKNFKLLQSQLKVKKAALTQAKTQRTRQSNVLAPVIDLKRGNAADDRQISDTPPHIAAGMKDTVSGGFSSGDVLIPLADEYDPMFPNDYEKVVKRHREERQRQREQERQKEIEEREKKRKERHEGGGAPSGFSRFPNPEGESDEEEDYEREKRKRNMGGAAIAPPTSLMERDISYSYDEDGRQRSKAAIPPPTFDDSDRPRSPPGPTNTFLANMGGTVAHKIMQKYGFREGQGLGKHEQGLSTALSVEKTSKRGGKIIIGDSTEKTSASASAASQNVADPHGSNSADASKKNEANPLTEILKCPTKVVLLRNMVGRGEVDEDLEAETKEECEKYGKVTKCVIFEISGVTDDEAVRIFLEFERVESAIKAVVDLNGRYFGGRVVKACFYNLDKFRVLDLGDQV
ncbi:splicing factor 45 isoform X4 [Pseudorasbora parva]|uniref:splicing factor 45 isoform X4 n=1 Tax=Pseudorasbora parva TaxID=51549 RepID=UPI00351DF892